MKITLLVLALGLILASGLRAATPAQYDQALGQVERALLSQSRAIRAEVVPQGEPPILTAQRVLAPIHSVDAKGSAPRTVDSSLLLAQIAAAGNEHDRKKSASEYASLAKQIDVLRRDLAPDEDAPARPSNPIAAARAVLAKPDYSSDPLPPPSLTDRLAEWLDKELSKMRGPRFHGPTPNINPAVLLWTLYIILGLAFLALVWVLVRALMRRGPRVKPLALDETETALVEARDMDSLLGLAEQQAKAGDYRRAFRLIYLATLIALDTGGVLRFDRSKTNWEYLRALRASGRDDVYQALTPMTREFDRVWYGFASATAGDYARARSQYEALQAAPQAGTG